jgi:hypothetical protein
MELEIERVEDHRGNLPCSIEGCGSPGLKEVDFPGKSYVLCYGHYFAFEADSSWLFEFHRENTRALCENG